MVAGDRAALGIPEELEAEVVVVQGGVGDAEAVVRVDVEKVVVGGEVEAAPGRVMVAVKVFFCFGHFREIPFCINI